MTVHIYLSSGSGNWLALPRIGTALAGGFFFAHTLALMVLVPERVPQMLNVRLAAVMLFLLRVALGMLAWWTYLGLILYQTGPDWFVLFQGGLGLAVAASLQMPLRSALPLSILAIWLPIAGNYWLFLQAGSAEASPPQLLLYFPPSRMNAIYWLAIPFATLLALGIHLPRWRFAGNAR